MQWKLPCGRIFHSAFEASRRTRQLRPRTRVLSTSMGAYLKHLQSLPCRSPTCLEYNLIYNSMCARRGRCRSGWGFWDLPAVLKTGRSKQSGILDSKRRGAKARNKSGIKSWELFRENILDAMRWPHTTCGLWHRGSPGHHEENSTAEVPF